MVVLPGTETDGITTEGTVSDPMDTEGRETDGSDRAEVEMSDVSADTAAVAVVVIVAAAAVTVLIADPAVPTSDVGVEAFNRPAAWPTMDCTADPVDDSSGCVATEPSTSETTDPEPSSGLTEPVGADWARTVLGKALLVVDPTPGDEPDDSRLVTGFRAVGVLRVAVGAPEVEPVLPDPIDSTLASGAKRLDELAGVNAVADGAGRAEELAAGVDAFEAEGADVTAAAVVGLVVASEPTAGSAAFTVAAVAVVVEEDPPAPTNCDVTGSIASIKELESVLTEVDADPVTATRLDVNAVWASALLLHRAQRSVITKAPKRMKRTRARRHQTTPRASTRVCSNAQLSSGTGP